MELSLSQSDFDDFFKWLELNVSSITWEGRYHADFEDFWKNFFVPSITISRLQERFEYSKSVLKTGPLASWFSWLNQKFICYCFVKKGLNLREVSFQTSKNESEVALILRDFYFERFPYLEDELNDLFQISNVTSENIFITNKEIIEKFSIKQDITGCFEEDIMTSLEVTLYPEWKQYLINMKKHFYDQKFNLKKLKDKTSFNKQVRFIQEVAILFIIGGVIIVLLKFGNKKYEEYLSNKISLFQPNFFWLDKSLSYKKLQIDNDVDIELTSNEIEDLEEVENKPDLFKSEEANRYEVESDVTVTSLDDLPQRFEGADFEQSTYEEKRKGGFRDVGFGSRKAYRVMMNSVQPTDAKSKLNEVLSLYGVEQVDNVKPGKVIPGGIYYNLYVPIKNLREFFAKINTIEKTTIYESKIRTRVPYGKSKVFVWIKSI